MKFVFVIMYQSSSSCRHRRKKKGDELHSNPPRNQDEEAHVGPMPRNLGIDVEVHTRAHGPTKKMPAPPGIFDSRSVPRSHRRQHCLSAGRICELVVPAVVWFFLCHWPILADWIMPSSLPVLDEPRRRHPCRLGATYRHHAMLYFSFSSQVRSEAGSSAHPW